NSSLTQKSFESDVINTRTLGNCLVGACAAPAVDPPRELRKPSHRSLEPKVRDLSSILQRDIRECISARLGDCARHVRDAVVDHTLDLVRWAVMRRRTTSLDTASLVDGHIHDD